MCCGAIVEYGGDPLIALDAILDRLPEIHRGARDFIAACNQVADERRGPDGNRVEEPVEAYGQEVARSHPEAANAYIASRPLAIGTIAMLSRSKEARRRARGRTILLPLSLDLDKAMGSRTSFLTKMLEVLDDEPLLVLHPEERKGYRLRMSGVGMNAELFVLLDDLLIGDPARGWLPGERPDPDVVASCRDQHPEVAKGKYVVGAFNYCNWQALRADLTVPQGHMHATDHWIWMEGLPADIHPFEGLRVILLGPPPYDRILQGGRCFDGMKAELVVEEQLTTSEVDNWLRRIARAANPS